VRVGILTISDAGARGERRDTSGDAAERWARERGYDVAVRTLIPDDTAQIVATLTEWCDSDRADLVLTTGGTGLSPRDTTDRLVQELGVPRNLAYRIVQEQAR